MARPRVVVDTQATNPKLFADLEEEGDNATKRELQDLCDDALDDTRRVAWLSEISSHIIRVFEGDTLMTFGYVNVGPYVHKLNERSVPADYVELILLCGRYKSGSWKGSELVVDKTIQLARENGKVAVRLEALNKELLAKVYYPMGFKDVPGKYLKAELRPLPPAYGGMWKKSGGGVMDTVGITDDQKEALMKMKEASETYNRQREAQARATPAAPVKAKFPWRDFDDVLDGKLDVDTFGDRVFSRMNSISPDMKRNGKTPLEIAEEAGNEELVAVLKKLSGGRRRRSRLNVKRRGTKRNGRSGKDRKSRKLATRRR
jgi:hypothetical protein